MERRLIVIGLILVLMATLTIAYFKMNPGLSIKPIVSSSNTNTDEPFFSDSSTIMYFWQPGCSYCKQQAPILKEITISTGLMVKSMNVEANPTYWQKYQLTGTPTFIDTNNKRLIGLQKNKDKLIQFMKEGTNAR